MKNKLIIAFTVIMIVALSAGLFACDGGGNNSSGGGVSYEPQVVNEVTDVKIAYNNSKITSGFYEADLSAKTVQFTAEIRKKGSPEFDIMFETGDEKIATVTNEGLVTLKAKGETSLTLSAGGKTHVIALIVKDGLGEEKYAVKVTGGAADKTLAEAGERVRLTVDFAALETERLNFVEWEFLNADTNEKVTTLWTNGNEIEMPAFPLSIIAITEEKLFTLNAVASTVTSAVKDGEEVSAEIVEKDGENNVYAFPYGTQITLERRAEQSDEIFVGWDVASRRNRKSGAENDTYTFTMPDETYSVFSAFSTKREIVFGANSVTGDRARITGGVVDETEDKDFEGLSGYRYNFAANKGAGNSGYSSENLTGVANFSTLRYGSQTVKVIFKNRSNIDMKFEFYAVSYLAVATTGVVEIKAGETVKTFMIASAGFHNPSFALVLRESLKGNAGEKATLDMVYVSADTYPEGDPQFAVIDAEYVTLKQTTNGADYPAGTGIRGDCWTPIGPVGVSFGGRKNVNNAKGITNLVSRENYISYGATAPYIYAEVSNAPEYKADEKVSVYFRVINNNAYEGKFIFALGVTSNPLTDGKAVKKEIDMKANDVYTFGLMLTREKADKLYVSIVKPARGTGTITDFNMVIQMMYNNQLNVEADNIVGA